MKRYIRIGTPILQLKLYGRENIEYDNMGAEGF